MTMIDTHTHLYLNAFDGDRDAVLARAASAGVSRFLLPAIDSSTHAALLSLEVASTPCEAMMGLHPCSVTEGWERELTVVEKKLGERSWVAVGEIGLDFYWDRTHEAAQYKAFKQQLELAERHGLPVSVHTRSATPEAIGVIQTFPNVRGVFHCFSGTAGEAQQLADLGWYLGIGGVITYKNSGLAEAIAAVPKEKILLETDAPYLSPVPYRGKRNEPAYLVPILEKLAALWELAPAEAAVITTGNTEALFGVSDQKRSH